DPRFTEAGPAAASVVVAGRSVAAETTVVPAAIMEITAMGTMNRVLSLKFSPHGLRDRSSGFRRIRGRPAPELVDLRGAPRVHGPCRSLPNLTETGHIGPAKEDCNKECLSPARVVLP